MPAIVSPTDLQLLGACQKSAGLRRATVLAKDSVPELKPHDLRHGVAMEVLEQQHDLEQVRALLGHKRIDTTQVYASIRPAQLKRAVAFYEDKAARMLSG